MNTHNGKLQKLPHARDIEIILQHTERYTYTTPKGIYIYIHRNAYIHTYTEKNYNSVCTKGKTCGDDRGQTLGNGSYSQRNGNLEVIDGALDV